LPTAERDGAVNFTVDFKELSQDGVRTDFSENLGASLFNYDLSNETASCQIHLARQYF